MSATLGARGVVPENHPHYFHPFDLGGAGLARAEADVVLVVGARLGEYDGWGGPPMWGDPARADDDPDRRRPDVDRPEPPRRPRRSSPTPSPRSPRCSTAVRKRRRPAGEPADLARYREQSAETMQTGHRVPRRASARPA